MSEENEISSVPMTPSPPRPRPMAPNLPVSCPPFQLHSPSFSMSPLLCSQLRMAPRTQTTPRTPAALRRSTTPRVMMSPSTNPVRIALGLRKLDPQDAWLPITESRNGNKYYAAFHTLCSGIGFQALLLPVAFTTLGWPWGLISLTVAFIWQLFTLFQLVQLHEAPDTGMRYSRYLQLFDAAFENKVGNFVVWLSIMFLSSGTCIALILLGGSTLQTFVHSTCNVKILTAAEWYFVFTCAVVLLSLLPNLNSLAGVSLIGAVTAVGFCTLIWIESIINGPIPQVSYEPVKANTRIEQIFSVFNALGIIAFAFRGHNLILEIQATMPSNEYPSRVPMWKGVKSAYTLIAMCLYPLAISGYWAHGHKMLNDEGMLSALYKFNNQDKSQILVSLTSVLVIVNALTSFQIYAMPTFDDMESKYTSRKKRPCPWWLRTVFRAFFGLGCFFAAVAMPFPRGLNGLIGGITLPVSMAYPCFMWLKIKKPGKYGMMWSLNWGLGLGGVLLSSLVVAAGIHVLINSGVQGSFFKPL